jgi:hypothetical protein
MMLTTSNTVFHKMLQLCGVLAYAVPASYCMWSTLLSCASGVLGALYTPSGAHSCRVPVVCGCSAPS